MGGLTKPNDAIEFEEPSHSVCECCGGTTTTLTRFVTRNGDAFAIYFARFADNHPEKYVSILVGFGDWAEQADPGSRTAIAFRIWGSDTGYQVGLVDAENDWDTDFLGVKLKREEALQCLFRQETYDLSDHIVECDRPIIDYLSTR